MSNKKYQIFVSSTYEDLKEERKSIIENISKMGHLPVGMELFVASTDEQFEYIKKVIDNCDYYILIVGGRYGAISPNTQISYTEMEYDYAIKKNIPVLVFPYSDMDLLPNEKKDANLTKIKSFCEKVSSNRMCDLWDNKDKLLSNVIIALNKIFSEQPQRGWMRPDEIDNTKLLTELNDIRKENEILKNKLSEYENNLKPQIENLAGMNEIFEISFRYGCFNSSINGLRDDKIKVSWNDIFSYVAPELISPLSAGSLRFKLDKDFIRRYAERTYSEIYLNDDDVNTIKIQFLSQGLITAYSASTVKGGVSEFIQLTQKGLEYLKQIKTVKSAK